MNLVDTGHLLNRIQDSYPNVRLSETAVDTWHEILGGHPTPLVYAAFRICADRSPEFAPSAYAILGEIERSIDDAPSPDEVWLGIMRVVKEVANPDHRTRGIRMIAEIDADAATIIDEGITWFALCSTDTAKLDHTYRRFAAMLTDVRDKRKVKNAIEPFKEPKMTSGSTGFRKLTAQSSTEDHRIAISDALPATFGEELGSSVIEHKTFVSDDEDDYYPEVDE